MNMKWIFSKAVGVALIGLGFIIPIYDLIWEYFYFSSVFDLDVVELVVGIVMALAGLLFIFPMRRDKKLNPPIVWYILAAILSISLGYYIGVEIIWITGGSIIGILMYLPVSLWLVHLYAHDKKRFGYVFSATVGGLTAQLLGGSLFDGLDILIITVPGVLLGLGTYGFSSMSRERKKTFLTTPPGLWISAPIAVVAVGIFPLTLFIWGFIWSDSDIGEIFSFGIYPLLAALLTFIWGFRRYRTWAVAIPVLLGGGVSYFVAFNLLILYALWAGGG